METGTKISAIAHTGLVAVAIFGGAFRSEPLPFDVQDVSVVTAEEFAALSAPRTAPEVIEQPVALDQPDAILDQPELPDVSEVEPEQPTPEPIETPDPEDAPEIVVETPEPEIEPDTPTLEEPDPELAALPEPPGVRPNPRPAERVAPTPAPAPPLDATPDDVLNPPSERDQTSEQPQEEQEPTAPEEATDQIVTEATETEDSAPLRSPRPPARRPSPPAQQETPTETAQSPSTDRDSVEDALQEALAPAPTPTGPPLTGGEKDAFRVAVQQCWIVDVGGQAANVTVTVGMSMEQSGKVIAGSLRLVSSEGGTGAAANAAFQAARRAIFRCQKDGYDLPPDKYGQWQEIEITFDPRKMRNR